ncbi:MAG: hypothetical protein R3339_09725, partial [Thermodesulfobacteriota bacterium]|nr:hypothetical protein [Thermodesulfobacteriota bacterium]
LGRSDGGCGWVFQVRPDGQIESFHPWKGARIYEGEARKIQTLVIKGQSLILVATNNGALYMGGQQGD